MVYSTQYIVYLLTLHQFLLGHVEVKLDVETLHKLSDRISVGIRFLQPWSHVKIIFGWKKDI